MSDVQNQFNLLNNYIKTLQQQNLSKSNQIRTLTDQNNQLIQQCELLRSKPRQQTVISTVASSQLQQTIQRLQSQLKQSKTAYTLLVEQSQQGGQSQKLRQDVRRLTEEKMILYQYKQKLQKQLREIGFKSTDSYISKVKQLEYLVEDSTKKVKTYQTKVVDYERKLTLLTNQITIKNSQIQRLNDKVRSITETNTQTNTLTASNKSYQLKIDEYENKITQMSSQLTIARSEIQRLKEKESQLVIIQRENTTLKQQVQSLNVKITSLSSSTSLSTVQINSYQTTINSLKNQQKDWQRQKQQLQIRISDLQTQIVQKSNTIAQLRLRDEFLRTKQSADISKDKEIQNLNNIIRVLRIEIEDHKRTISFRDSTIKGLQNKISSSQYSKSTEITSIQRVIQEKNTEINRLIESHNQKVTQLSLQIQKYKSISIVNAQASNQIVSLRDQNNFLKRQSQNSQILIQQLQRQKQMLKLRIRDLEEQLSRSRVQVSEVKTFVTKSDNNQTQLTRLVRELRYELEQVKKSNAIIHEQNHKMHQYLAELSQSQVQIPYFGNEASIVRYHSPQNATSFHQQVSSPSQLRLNMQNESFRKSKHYHQPYFKSQMNIDKKRQLRNDRSGMSPVRDVKQPSLNNRQKWESLQRKISALRVQNDQLKRTLLYQ